MSDVTTTASRMGAAVMFAGAGTVSDPAVSMGGTDGGINGTVETEHFEHKFDQTGTAPVDLTRTGFRARFEANFAEVTLDNLVNSFPGDAITGSDPNRTVKLNGNVGQQALGRDQGRMDAQLDPLFAALGDAEQLDAVTQLFGVLDVGGF